MATTSFIVVVTGLCCLGLIIIAGVVLFLVQRKLGYRQKETAQQKINNAWDSILEASARRHNILQGTTLHCEPRIPPLGTIQSHIFLSAKHPTHDYQHYVRTEIKDLQITDFSKMIRLSYSLTEAGAHAGDLSKLIIEELAKLSKSGTLSALDDLIELLKIEAQIPRLEITTDTMVGIVDTLRSPLATKEQRQRISAISSLVFTIIDYEEHPSYTRTPGVEEVKVLGKYTFRDYIKDKWKIDIREFGG